jgi:hypothetical protein
VASRHHSAEADPNDCSMVAVNTAIAAWHNTELLANFALDMNDPIFCLSSFSVSLTHRLGGRSACHIMNFTMDMYLLLLSVLFTNVYATSWHPPASTINLYDQADPLGWTPAPTAAPAPFELFKRQAESSSLCGYVQGNQCNLLLTKPSNLCVPNTFASQLHSVQ